MNISQDEKEKIESCIYGFIIGDAMGIPSEFERRNDLLNNPITDMVGFGAHSVPPGSWGEDTSLTLATMSSITRNEKIDYDDIMLGYTKWYREGRYSSYKRAFGVSNTCNISIRNYYKKGITPLECGLSKESDNDNSSLKRILPLALYCYYKNIPDTEITNLVKEYSSLTNRHEISFIGCFIFIKYINFLLQGDNQLAAYKKIKKLDLSIYSKEAVQNYKSILEDDIYKIKFEDLNSSNHIIDTLECVFWMSINSKKFTHAIIGSINLGGDTNTIGALTGAISGIVFGNESIPLKWLNKLQRKDYIDEKISDYINFLLKYY